jgi:hypothetical protein
MRTYSVSELFKYTRSDLLALHARVVAELSTFSETERELALENLQRIRRVLSHPTVTPS